MHHDVFWTPREATGLEHLRISADAHGRVADGVIVRQQGRSVIRAQYRIRATADWVFRSLWLSLLDDGPTLSLHTDGSGQWWNGAGDSYPELHGCHEVDISATPFTNTLAIGRLKLEPGQRADIHAVYIALPSLAIGTLAQIYTCHSAHHYTYENRDGSFQAELPLDADGLVLDYPALFQRVTFQERGA